MSTEKTIFEHELYETWYLIISRCYRKNAISYNAYGNKGIKVDIRWHKFENFLEDMGEKPTEKHQIDRIDATKGYSKDNCRWATPQQNIMNRRKTIKNKSGFKGVSPRPSGRWRSAIRKNGKDYVLGNSFKTKEEAATAYDKKAKELFGEFANLNFPENK